MRGFSHGCAHRVASDNRQRTNSLGQMPHHGRKVGPFRTFFKQDMS
jgi:hypothetical protein